MRAKRSIFDSTRLRYSSVFCSVASRVVTTTCTFTSTRRRVRGGFTSSVVRDASSDMPLRHRRIRREHIPAVSHARHRTRLISSSHALTRYPFVIKHTRSASGTTSFLYSTSAQYARIRNSAHPVPHMPACTWSPRQNTTAPFGTGTKSVALVAFTGIGFDTSRAPREGSDTPSSSATIIEMCLWPGHFRPSRSVCQSWRFALLSPFGEWQ